MVQTVTEGLVLDSSAIVAVFLEEPRFESLREKIDRSRILVGAPTLFETAIVLAGRRVDPAAVWIERFVRAMEVEVVTFTQEHYRSALDAFLRFGKGRHAAALNMGDCLAYAIADISGLPLLYTGDDFAKTDIEAA